MTDKHAYLQMPIEVFGDRIAGDVDADVKCIVSRNRRTAGDILGDELAQVGKEVIDEYVNGTLKGDTLRAMINAGIPSPF